MHISTLGLALLLTGLLACNAADRPSPLGLDGELDRIAVGAVEGVQGSVTGSAHLQFFPLPGLGLRRLTFNAVEHQDGTVAGEWQIVVGATILHGAIDCLTILPGGHAARVSGVVEQALFTTFLPGTAFAMEFTDHGQGSDEPADEATALLAFRNTSPEVGRLFCETGVAPADLEVMEILHGNFQIHVFE